jgi:subtilase family serine protease
MLLPVALLSTVPAFANSPTTTPATPTPISSTAPTSVTYTQVCTAASVGYASCLALMAVQAVSSKVLLVKPLAQASGGHPYTPASLHRAYNLPSAAHGTPLVAIVDAYANPKLASDLATYRSHWGLPACTTSNGCFKVVNQTGGKTLPAGNVSWGAEESLDVDIVSAICQNCHILVVEANSASFANLGIAVNEAVKLGAIAVSNSYGGREFSGESSYCSSYQHNYVAITASTGDGGLGATFPSICPSVTSVGGTTLNSNGSETAWNTSSKSGAGGGCSAAIALPSWQQSSVTHCSRHAAADVSAVANPSTGVYVYDSYNEPGWLMFGGTSVSTPIIASIFALAGNVSSTRYPASLPWMRYASGCLFEVGAVRYAYQTGLGSPNGTGCF